MTVPPERDDDSLVLDFLGLGTPQALEPVDSPAEPVRPFSSSRDIVAAPPTRRELRERERVESPAPSRGSSGPRSTPRAKPRRTAKISLRRDAVRVAGTKKTLGRRLLSFAAMIFAGAFAFGLTVPANAFNQPEEVVLAESLAMESQSAEVDASLVSFAERDAWTVTSWAEMLRLRYGNRSFDYAIGSGPVRWPFPVAVPISSGFGDRAAPCRGCSTDHRGIDFNPGAGAAIFAIADGVVVERQLSGGLGNFVAIRHQIDGQAVYSGYAHMQHGSSPLNVGDTVLVGDFVGLVGATGLASGAHLHLSIGIDAVTNYVDPYTFLKRYAG